MFAALELEHNARSFGESSSIAAPLIFASQLPVEGFVQQSGLECVQFGGEVGVMTTGPVGAVDLGLGVGLGLGACASARSADLVMTATWVGFMTLT